MKILFFSYLNYDNLDYKGGNWILTLSNLLAKDAFHNVAIAYPSYHRISKYERDGILFYPIPIKTTFFDKVRDVILNKPKLIQNDIAVNNIVEEFEPTIIQLFGLETEFSKILYSIKNIPIVVHLQGICEPIIERWFPVGFNKIWVKRQYPLRNQFLRITTTDKYFRTKSIERVEKESFIHYSYYFGRTKWDKALCLQFSNNAKYFICNEVLRDEFYKCQWKNNKKNNTLISVCNGEIYKGFDVILRTANILKRKGVEFQWIVIGINDNDPILKVIEKYYGYSFSDVQVKFIGKKDAFEIVKILLDSSAFIHPTHIDNSPNSLCEAMVMGVPCIASNVGGISSLINDGVDGLLFPDGDYLYLASLIEELISSDSLSIELSDNARKSAHLRHNPDTIVQVLLENYHSIINNFNLKNGL